jgi:2',3'-cyclic-nucleotide 2'-phosphodiesterase (5'-nucleotidase family)
LCSAGDFYGGADAFSEPKSHFIADMMGYLEYDAIGVGEMDLNYGLDKLVEDAERYDLNMTCANLVIKPGSKEAGSNRRSGRGEKRSLQAELNTVFPPYLVVERDGLRIGFVALLAPQTKSHRAGDAGDEIEALTYVIKDPWEIAKAVLPAARKKCDVLVLLAHMDGFDLEDKLPEFQDIDIVIRGHNAQTTRSIEPVMIGTVPVYIATSQGQTIGNLSITVDSDNKIIDTNNKIHFLDASVPDDPVVAALLDEFDEENKRAQKILYAKEQLKASGSSEQSGDVYLGVGVCMTCHTEDFNIYAQTQHAKAYRTLSAQFVQRDTSCIGCHSTGYGQKGGYPGFRRLGGRVDLVDVQCEACHGPGNEHSRDGSYVDNALNSCIKCHTEEQDPDFDFAKAWEKIKH